MKKDTFKTMVIICVVVGIVWGLVRITLGFESMVFSALLSIFVFLASKEEK